MYDRTGNYLILAILLGMILGVVVVGIFGDAAIHVKFLGDIFLNALKMVVIPLLFCSMIVGISNLGDVRKLGRTGAKTLLYFLATSTVAVVIGLILVNVVQPGNGFTFSGSAAPTDLLQGRESYSFFTWFSQQIPSNIIEAAANTQVLPIIIFAIIFGGVLTTIGSKGRPVIAFFDGLNDVIMKIVHLIMWFAPIGIFGLVAGILAEQGGLGGFMNILSALGKYSMVVIIGLFIHGVIILPLILKFIAGKSPFEYFLGMSQALMTAFATASSSATLPVTMDCVEEKNDIDKRASSFVLPLGSTINMDGTALYEAVAAIFIAQAYGISMPLWSQVTICITAVLASIGAAGIPQAGLITMVLVLQAVGLPLEGIGMILAIDWFLDRCRTTVNVWGDSIGAAVIASTSEIGLVDRRRRKASPSTDPRARRSSSRRDDSRGRRRGRDTGRPSQDRRDSRDSRDSGGDRKKTGGMRGLDRKPDRGARKSDRDQKGRPTRRVVHQVDSAPVAEQREEYRPAASVESRPERPVVSSDEGRSKPDGGRRDSATRSGSAPAPKPSVPKETPADGKPATEPETKKSGKQVYGRKRTRGVRGKSRDTKSSTETATASAAAITAKPDAAPSTDATDVYDVPRFPKSILDDLGASGSDVREKVDTDARDDGKATNSSPARAASGNRADTRTESDKPVAETSGKNGTSSRDFSRLDKAILGGPDSSEGDTSPTPVADTASNDSADDSVTTSSVPTPAETKVVSETPAVTVSDAPAPDEKPAGNEPEKPPEVVSSTRDDAAAAASAEKPEAAGATEKARDEAAELVSVSETRRNRVYQNGDDAADASRKDTDSGDESEAVESTTEEDNDDQVIWGRRKTPRTKR